MVFAQWPFKYKIASITLFMLYFGVTSLLRGNWREGLPLLGLCFIYPAWAINPKIFFLPVKKGLEENQRFIEQHGLLKKLMYIGLFFIYAYVALRIANVLALF